ncbi:hypothetical protein AAHA92_21855 [Salvia divinorum]|uniref:Uncharacterized protein n=1 Tax=Salvia divinorum TaxID=28513 RepID=A0ABD1GM38_SALDI
MFELPSPVSVPGVGTPSARRRRRAPARQRRTVRPAAGERDIGAAPTSFGEGRHPEGMGSAGCSVRGSRAPTSFQILRRSRQSYADNGCIEWPVATSTSGGCTGQRQVCTGSGVEDEAAVACGALGQ